MQKLAPRGLNDPPKVTGFRGGITGLLNADTPISTLPGFAAGPQARACSTLNLWSQGENRNTNVTI